MGACGRRSEETAREGGRERRRGWKAKEGSVGARGEWGLVFERKYREREREREREIERDR
jgi:hypothetical protein